MRRFNSSKNIVAKDAKEQMQKKLDKLVSLMKKNGFKAKQKNRTGDDPHGVMDYTLTIFGQIANVFVTRNQTGLGSKTPLKIMIYIPSYDGMLFEWDKYVKGINIIDKFVQDVKQIDQDFVK